MPDIPNKQDIKHEQVSVFNYFHEYGVVKGTIKYLKEKKEE